MASIEIESVTYVAEPPVRLLSAGIDLPLAPGIIGGSFLNVAGWAVGRELEVASVQIVYDEGLVLGSTRLPLVRTDVIDHLALADRSTKSGFDLLVSVVGLPSPFELRVRAGFEPPGAKRESEVFAIIRGRHARPPSPFPTRLRPVSLTSLGRCGTTLVMSMLARHPEVVVHQVFPYESRFAGYWMHALRILGGHANHDFSSHPDEFLNATYWIGYNPYAVDRGPSGERLRSWLRDDLIGEVAAFCQRNVESAYRRIALDQEQPNATCFAEKHVPTVVPRLLWQVYGDAAREIFLVRDLRDVLASIKAFDERRGSGGFLEAGAIDRKAVVELVRDFTRLLRCWRERRGRALLVRYEDVVLEPSIWLRRIADYLGIDSSDAMIERMMAAATVESAEIRQHRTTAVWEESVGRHRRDLSEELSACCRELGSDVLKELDYAI